MHVYNYKLSRFFTQIFPLNISPHSRSTSKELFFIKHKKEKMLGSSEWSSGCESGWTLYLDHSVSSSPSPSCFRDINGFENRRKSKDSWDQNYVHHEDEEDEEEDDLSMISDASSGPRNISEEESVKKINGVGPKKQSKREKKRRDCDKMNSVLDDTASSHVSRVFFSKKLL